jgi:hypothetical protein
MKMRDLLNVLKHRAPSKPRAAGAASRDWTNTWTSRDWADLPTYHPRKESDAL